MINQATKIANEIFISRYSDAQVLFLAGSIVRGEGTAYSDLDLVVIFDKLPTAYREAFVFQGFPVEAFVHDAETLNYFLLEAGPPSGIPGLATMILEGIEIPAPTEVSQSLKRLARSCLESGPSTLSTEDILRMRYNITCLVDDIRQPRSKEELVASGTALYETLADYFFRSRSLWSARGKSIPRVLKQTDPNFALRYCDAFEELFAAGLVAKVIALAQEILERDGGFLFDGYKLDAPSNHRRPLL